MTYWRNNLLFLYFRFYVFLIVILPTGSYMSQVSKQRLVFGYVYLFSQNALPDIDWKYRNDWTKRLKNIAKKIFLTPWLRENCKGEMKRSFLINEVMSCRLLYSSQFTKATGYRYSMENFWKFLETHLWQKTILVKLLLRPFRARSNESTATFKSCIWENTTLSIKFNNKLVQLDGLSLSTNIEIFLPPSKYPCYATSSQFVAITNWAWFLFNLCVLDQITAAVQFLRLTKLQAVIPQFH